MTREEFNTRYDVHKPVAAGGPGLARSFFGRSRATKAVVLVHFLDAGGRPNPEDALARLEALGPEDRKVVLETCEVDGTIVVVTRFIWDFTTFDAWLTSLGRQGARAEAQAPASAPGEFTRLFGSPVAGSAPAGPPAPPGAASPPGEFTQLFGEQAHPPRPAPPSPARGGPRDASDAPTEQIAARVPGEFTKLFKAPSMPGPPTGPAPGTRVPGTAEPPRAPPPPAPAKSGPGEFTRLFGAAVPPQATGSPAAPAWPPPAAPPPAPPPLSQPLFPEPSTPVDDLAQRLARGVDQPPVPPGATRVEPASRPPREDVPPPTAPGDFTRMFGGVGQPPEVTGPRTSLAMPAPGFPTRPPDPPSASPSHPGPAAPPSTDYLARLHGSTPVPAAGSPLASPTPPVRGGPSEFTRALQRVSIAGARAETEVPEPQPAGARSALPIVLMVCGVLLVLGLAVVLYFLLTAE